MLVHEVQEIVVPSGNGALSVIEQTGASRWSRATPARSPDRSAKASSAASEYAASYPMDKVYNRRRPVDSEAVLLRLIRSTARSAPSLPGYVRGGPVCAYRRIRNRRSSSDSWTRLAWGG